MLEYISQLDFLTSIFLFSLFFCLLIVAMVATHCPSLLRNIVTFAERHGELATNMHYSKCIDSFLSFSKKERYVKLGKHCWVFGSTQDGTF